MNRLVWIGVLLVSLHASGQEARPAAADPLLEKRVTGLAQELRCLVCQNQTIADSDAPLAVDLRNQIREQMRRGASEQEITAYMVERYGDFVLYRPPFKGTTLLLWIGPFMLLGLGVWLLVRRIRRRRAEAAAAAPLSEAERARAAELLDSQ